MLGALLVCMKILQLSWIVSSPLARVCIVFCCRKRGAESHTAPPTSCDFPRTGRAGKRERWEENKIQGWPGGSEDEFAHAGRYTSPDFRLPHKHDYKFFLFPWPLKNKLPALLARIRHAFDVLFFFRLDRSGGGYGDRDNKKKKKKICENMVPFYVTEDVEDVRSTAMLR